MNLCSPVLGDVKAPLEFQMLVLVVINEGGNGGVVASSKHAGRRVFLGNYSQSLARVFQRITPLRKRVLTSLLVELLVLGIWCVASLYID